MKHKRVFTDEQRAASAERMRKMSSERWAKKREVESVVAVKGRAADVQAVLDTMSPERRAKLEQIQARNLAQLAQTKDGQEAIARLEARHTVGDPKPLNNPATIELPRPIVRDVPMKVPFRLTGSISGLMVSELGPCQCGEQKLKWHPVCLNG